MTEREEIVCITNRLAEQGIYVDTFKRSDDWVAYVCEHPEMWEAGQTELEAIKKLEITRGAK